MCVRGRGDIFGAARLNYKLFTNIAGLVVWASRLGLTITRGGTDPASRMKVNRRRAVPARAGRRHRALLLRAPQADARGRRPLSSLAGAETSAVHRLLARVVAQEVVEKVVLDLVAAAHRRKGLPVERPVLVISPEVADLSGDVVAKCQTQPERV